MNSDMPEASERSIAIVNKLGLHARAAAKFVQLATTFEASVQVRRDDLVVDGKSIMGVLMLAAAKGTTIVITADGPDAGEALDALVALIASGFGEDD